MQCLADLFSLRRIDGFIDCRARIHKTSERAAETARSLRSIDPRNRMRTRNKQRQPHSHHGRGGMRHTRVPAADCAQLINIFRLKDRQKSAMTLALTRTIRSSRCANAGRGQGIVLCDGALGHPATAMTACANCAASWRAIAEYTAKRAM